MFCIVLKTGGKVLGIGHGIQHRTHRNLTATPIHSTFSGSDSKMARARRPLGTYVTQKARGILCCDSVGGWSNFFLRRFPCIGFARSYSGKKFVGDCIAGLTLALTVIPMGMGYAALADLPLQYGLYASYVPGFIYAVFGTCKEITIGPTAVNALMTANYAGMYKTGIVEAALTLGFFSGAIEIAAGVLNLGFLTNFISTPVIAAFTSAVSINVMTSQVKGLLGLKKVPGRGFLNTWKAVFENITSIRPVDAAIGFTSLGVILLLRSLRNFKCCRPSDDEEAAEPSIGISGRLQRFWGRVIWVITVSRNSIVLIVSCILAYYLIEVQGMKDVVEVTGNVKAGIPQWQLPWQFTLSNESVNNGEVTSAAELQTQNTSPSTGMLESEEDATAEMMDGPFEIAANIGSGLVFLPLVSMIQIIAIVHNFSPPTKQVDASQEILALGMCQFVGSFAGSLPITASFGRSTVNSASGVQTPFGGILTGVLVIAACSFLTPHFAFIPTASLSAVIISSVVLTIDIEIILPIWKSKKLDLIPYLVTLLVGVFMSVEIGMIAGTVAQLLILLYTSSRPRVKVSETRVETTPYILVQPDRSLNYPSLDKIRHKLSEASTAYGTDKQMYNITTATLGDDISDSSSDDEGDLNKTSGTNCNKIR